MSVGPAQHTKAPQSGGLAPRQFGLKSFSTSLPSIVARAPQAPPPALGGVLAFMRLIWAVDHGLQRASKRMHATLGVTGPQRLVLRIVGRYPGLSAGRLAELLHVHPSTLTGILERLGRQGLLLRRTDPLDRRRVLLTLTDRGRVFAVETEGTVEAAVQRALVRAPPSQVEAGRRLLSSLAEVLGSFPAAHAEPGRRARRARGGRSGRRPPRG